MHLVFSQFATTVHLARPVIDVEFDGSLRFYTHAYADVRFCFLVPKPSVLELKRPQHVFDLNEDISEPSTNIFV